MYLFTHKKHEILKHSSSLFILSSRIPVMFLDDDLRTFQWQQKKGRLYVRFYYGFMVLLFYSFWLFSSLSLSHSISYMFVCLLHCVFFTLQLITLAHFFMYVVSNPKSRWKPLFLLLFCFCHSLLLVCFDHLSRCLTIKQIDSYSVWYKLVLVYCDWKRSGFLLCR